MASAPPQGFTASSLDIASSAESENNRRETKDVSLLEKNNALLNNLVRQLELITNEENFDGDENLSGSS